MIVLPASLDAYARRRGAAAGRLWQTGLVVGSPPWRLDDPSITRNRLAVAYFQAFADAVAARSKAI